MLNKHIYQLQGMYFLTFFMTNVFFLFSLMLHLLIPQKQQE